MTPAYDRLGETVSCQKHLSTDRICVKMIECCSEDAVCNTIKLPIPCGQLG